MRTNFQAAIAALGNSAIIILTLLALASCGGGGGGGTGGTGGTEPINQLPSLTVNNQVEILEGSVAVTAATATDPEGQTLTFSLNPTADRDLFIISAGGDITFRTAPDYEIPADADDNNSYELTVVVTDSQNAADSEDIVVTVTDAIEGRVIDAPLSGSEIYILSAGQSATNTGESLATSDAEGYFFVPAPAGTGSMKILTRGGTDTETNVAMPGMTLISDLPNGSTDSVAVTPISTVLASADSANDKQAILVALGISGTVEEFLTTDIWQEAKSGNSDAQSQQSTNQKIGLLISMAQSLLVGGSTAQLTEIAEKVAQEFAAKVSDNESIDLQSDSMISEILTEALSSIVVDAAVINAVSNNIADINELLSGEGVDPTSTEAADFIKTAQTELLEAVQDLASGDTTLENFVAGTDLAALFSDHDLYTANRNTVIGNFVVTDGTAGSTWNLGIQAFNAPSYGSCTNDGGTGCHSLNWTVETDNDRGNVLQVTYANDALHAGVYFQSSTAQDLSAYASGSFVFDIKVLDAGTNNLSDGFKIKMESADDKKSSELSINTAADASIVANGQWQTITIPVSKFTGDDTGGSLDLSEITVAMNIFPVAESGPGLVYQLDNAGFVSGVQTDDTSPESREGYSLVWSDEFSGTSLNTDDWTYEIGDGCPDLCGWGNRELEYYRSENATVASGLLTIEAREEYYGGKKYTSSRIKTEHKQFFKYGRIDIRAKMPQGQGLWPALWTLGENISTVGWPASGEIDIMEMVGGNGTDGYNDSTTHGTIHFETGDGCGFNCRDYQGGKKSLSSGKLADDFNVFSIDWTTDSITWLLNDVSFHSEQITPANRTEFHEDFFFIFNVAVGGEWPGSPDSTSQFPQQMQVDYIRVFQLEP
jgi:beta-glucanase (GH16 family)